MSDTRANNDGAPELGIPLTTVVAIIDAARARDELEEEDLNEDVQDKETPEDGVTEMGGALGGLIDDLNEEEQANLIALAWLGRGDYTVDEWPEAMRLARERNAALTAARYLTEMELLGDLLSEGLAEMGAPAEEVGR